ncbi:MAG TPA: DinB family protein [Vicinamibacterales bacterium]|nr:DinB family protein [Vicinamibacterales bacterium]
MKIAVASLVLFAALAPAAIAGPMTTGERQRLVAHFEMTEAWLDDEVKNLSPAQLSFKMTPESWSVEEVVMHLAIAEPQYWQQFNESLARPVQPDFKPQATDLAMLWYGIDRTQRTTTGEARVPRDQFPDLKSSLASFRKLRAEMLKTAKETQEDLRGRQFLTASQDLYQWFLMISTHSHRHIMQIREVKAHPGFPKT